MLNKNINPYKQKKWIRKKEYILSKYNYECQESKRYPKERGTTAEVVHHIYQIEKYPELMFEDWNLLPLSTKKHNKMHKRKTHELTKLGMQWQRKRIREFERWKEEGII